MHPLLIGGLAWGFLALRARRQKVVPGGVSKESQLLTQTLSGVQPEPIPVVTSMPPAGEELGDDISIEQFLAAIQRDPHTVTTLTPEGQLQIPGSRGC